MWRSSFSLEEKNVEELELVIQAASFGNLESLVSTLRLEKEEVCGAALQFAALHGHARVVQHLCPLSENLDRSAFEKVWRLDGLEMTSSPLHIAVKEGHLDVVTEILPFFRRSSRFQYILGDPESIRQKLQPNAHSFMMKIWQERLQEAVSRKQTLICSWFRGLVQWAVRWGNAPIVKLLLTHPMLIPFDQDFEELPLPLHLAVHLNHLDVSKLLLCMCRNHSPRFSYPLYSDDGLTPLHVAAHSGSLLAVELLLSEATSMDANARSHPDLFTPLHMAANAGHVEVVSFFLQSLTRKPNHSGAEAPISTCRVDLTARDCMGRTALHYAVREGHEDVVQKLLDCADQMTPAVDLASLADHDGFLPLHMAARAGHVGLLRKLRSSYGGGIDRKARYSVHMKRRVAMEYMCTKKASNIYYGERWAFPRPRLVDSFFWETQGLTPLHLAVRYGHEAAVEELLQRDRNVPETSSLETSPLTFIDVEKYGLKLAEAASNFKYCRSRIEEEEKAMGELEQAWNKGTVPPLRMQIVQWLEEEDIGSFRRYWLRRAAKLGNWDLLKRVLDVLAEFQATSEKKTALQYEAQDCWALQNKLVREAFQQFTNEDFFRDISDGDERLFVELLLHLPGFTRDTVLGLLRLALKGKWLEAAKEIVLQVPQLASVDNGLAQVVLFSLQSDSFKNPFENIPAAAEQFLMAVVTREGLVGASTLLRTLLPWAKEQKLNNLVEVILDRPELKRGLYEDRQVYLDCANAILVGAALIAGVAFQGWLQPPLGYNYPYKGVEYAELQKPLMRTFWRFNNGAFFLAVGALIAGAKGAVPVARDTDIVKSVEKVKRAVAVASTLLGMALVCVMVAFTTAGFVVLPPLPADWRMMRRSVEWGATICGVALLWFYRSVLPLLGYHVRLARLTLGCLLLIPFLLISSIAELCGIHVDQMDKFLEEALLLEDVADGCSRCLETLGRVWNLVKKRLRDCLI